jgi:hypothetical protein
MPSKDPEEAWRIPEAYLLTGVGEERVAIPHLVLTFGGRGIELAKADAEVVWDCAWTQLDEVSTSERSILPDGTDGVVVVVIEHGGRQHRFVLPADNPDQLEAAIRARATSHRIRTFTPPQAVSRTLNVAVVVATVATWTALLLSAVHVLHF